jgi:hypothetical protein
MPKMTEAQKAEMFDRLQKTRVIQVRKDTSVNPPVKRIAQGDTKSIEVPDYVLSLEEERST